MAEDYGGVIRGLYNKTVVRLGPLARGYEFMSIAEDPGESGSASGQEGERWIGLVGGSWSGMVHLLTHHKVWELESSGTSTSPDQTCLI